MNTEIEVNAELPVIKTNFDLVKSDLAAHLKTYENVVVTIDTLAEDKKLAKTITATGKEFDTLRKEKLAEVSRPLVVFGDQMNELSGMCTSLAATIKSQVKVFEDAKLEEISKLLKSTMMAALDEANIDDEFRVLNIDHLIKLGAITKTGALNKASKDAINAIVSDKKAIMQTTQLRLVQLESGSFKAGLDIPLVRLNVEQFLFDTDEKYNEHLISAINSEFERQQAAKVRKKELEDKEILLAAKNAETKPETEAVVTQQDNRITGGATTTTRSRVQLRSYQQAQPSIEPQQAQQTPTIVDDGKIVWVATASFKLRVSSRVTADKISDKLTSMMLEAGISSLQNIEVKVDA